MKELRWLLFVALVILLLPWLGETLFNTKGEPREAIVAMSMLQSGDWILPVSYGADIPYKPPLLAWLIAIFSWAFNGGIVNEFTSRLPSAIAAILMIIAGYNWALSVTWRRTAVIMAVATITSFEVYRAAIACRVDMVLTACMCIALFQMYRWRNDRNHGTATPLMSLLRFGGIALLLSGAVLTKGPVGSLLPCLAMGIFCLLRGDNFFRTLFWLVCVCVLSFVLPALWYWQAYQVGGDEFLRLALEENIGRLTGTMTYESHLNPWYYNVVTILAGLLPWTLLLLFALIASCSNGTLVKALKRRTSWSEPTVFAVTVATVIFLFYCLPASKRSVYLLPMYPFLAYGIAQLIGNMQRQESLKVYCFIIFILAIVAPICGILMQWVDLSKLPIERMPLWRYPLALIPLASIWLWCKYRQYPIRNLLITTLLMYLAYGAAFQPMFLNAKSDIQGVVRVEMAMRNHKPVYTFNSDTLMRYYTLNFYLNDRLRRIDDAQLDSLDRFTLLSSPDDYRIIAKEHPEFKADTIPFLTRSCDTRRPIIMSRFQRISQ